MTPGEVLRRRPDCLVTLDDGGHVVTKRFTGSEHARAADDARHEHERLVGFGRALEQVDGAACPVALGLDLGPRPAVRMSRAPGAPLLTVLRTRALDAAALQRLAAVMAEAITAYVGVFAEPYWDFQFDNVVYDERSGGLTFLDFGLPPLTEMPSAMPPPLSTTLGNLAGSTIFQSVRPRWIWRIRQRRQALVLCSEVVRLVALDQETRAALPDGARQAFRRSARQGSWYRRAWFRAAAIALPRRVVLGGIALRPRRW